MAELSQIERKAKEALEKQQKVRIMIPSSEKERDAVQVGVNGYVFNIPRDVEVEVPEAVIEVLNNAKITSYTLKPRTEGEGNEMVAQDVRRIPYQTVSAPPPDTSIRGEAEGRKRVA